MKVEGQPSARPALKPAGQLSAVEQKQKAEKGLVTDNLMKNLRKTVYLVLGVAIGAWELYVGAISILMIFFFKEIEPWSSCLMVVFGPLVTLPAIVFGIRHPRASGISLCCGASLALLSIGISEGLHGENLLGVALYVSGPMYLFGFLNLLRSYQK